MVQQILIMMIGPIAFLLIMPDYRCQLMKLVKLPRYFCGVAAQFFLCRRADCRVDVDD